MKTIFDQPLVQTQELFSPRNFMIAINYLADNKADGTTFADMIGEKRRT
jgi:hypothetical protein